MSIHPTKFNDDGSIEVWFDEGRHGGTIPAAEVVWGTNPMDGSHNHTAIVLTCPDGCGSVSTWPVGGGADAVMGQQMFVNKVQAEGCACGNVPAANNATPEAHVRLLVSRMDGPQRWALEDPVMRSARNASESQFQVVYRTSDNLILGTDPSGGVGPDNGMAVIHDMAEHDVLMRTDPAYLSNDKAHVLPAPEA